MVKLLDQLDQVNLRIVKSARTQGEKDLEMHELIEQLRSLANQEYKSKQPQRYATSYAISDEEESPEEAARYTIVTIDNPFNASTEFLTQMCRRKDR